MTRWSASGLHLFISLVVGVAFVGLTLGVWYPGPFFDVSGAVGLLSILVPVDVVLGPFLTLLVFKKGKPSLMLDLSVIAILQTAALLYGAWTIAEVRPAYIVLFDKQLEVVRSIDVAKNAPWHAPLDGPEWVMVPPKKAEDLLKDVMAGVLPTRDIKQYQPLMKHESGFKAAMKTVEGLDSEPVQTQIKQELAAENLKPDEVRLLPILVRDLPMTAVFDRDSLELKAILPTPI